MFSFASDFPFLSNSSGSRKTTESKKKKYNNWFESCNGTQLKELCRAAKLPVSGTKPQLVDRLMGHEFSQELGASSAGYLKQQCKEKLLVQSGNKYDFILRLLNYQCSTGKLCAAGILSSILFTSEAAGLPYSMTQHRHVRVKREARSCFNSRTWFETKFSEPRENHPTESEAKQGVHPQQ